MKSSVGINNYILVWAVVIDDTLNFGSISIFQ